MLLWATLCLFTLSAQAELENKIPVRIQDMSNDSVTRSCAELMQQYIQRHPDLALTERTDINRVEVRFATDRPFGDVLRGVYQVWLVPGDRRWGYLFRTQLPMSKGGTPWSRATDMRDMTVPVMRASFGHAVRINFLAAVFTVWDEPNWADLDRSMEIAEEAVSRMIEDGKIKGGIEEIYE